MNHITLNIAGQRCSLGISRLRVQQQINEIPFAQLEIQLPTDNNGETDNAIQREANLFSLGTSIVIAVDKKPIFKGYLIQKKIQLKGKCKLLKLEARHVLQKLTFLPRSRIYRQQDDSRILKELLQAIEVKMIQDANAQLNNQHDQLVQFRLSDWQFIRSRLLSTNCWLLPDATNNNVVVSPLNQSMKTPKNLDRDSVDYTLYEVSLNFDGRFTVDSLSLQGWEISEQKLAKEQNSQAGNFYPWKSECKTEHSQLWKKNYAMAFSVMPETTLKNISDSWLNHQQMTGTQGHILLSGTQYFELGDTIKLTHFGDDLDGTAVISGVNQLFDTQNGWRSELMIGMSASILEPTPPVRSLHIAKVADFSSDPQHLERIPIYLPALNLPNSIVFARLSKPWASKESGFCFYPEPGDEVVVGFIDSDPRYPIILGSLHNPKNMSPFPPSKSNNCKALVVSKEDKKQSLIIDLDEQTLKLVAGSNSITLAEEEDITVSTPNTLQFTADMLKQQAKSRVSINAKDSVEISSSKINLKKN